MIFYGDSPKDYVAGKLMCNHIIIAQANSHWSDATTAGNFKLALKGTAIVWLKYIKDTERVVITLWYRIEPHFLSLLTKA
jgi:hypothetical protein